MSKISFALDHKVLVYQDIDWDENNFQRRSVLVRAEIVSENKINQCLVATLEKYSKCHLLGWGQCRKYCPLSSNSSKKTTLVDVFWIKSVNFPNRCWIHYSKLGKESNRLIASMSIKRDIYRQFPGVDVETTHPLAIRALTNSKPTNQRSVNKSPSMNEPNKQEKKQPPQLLPIRIIKNESLSPPPTEIKKEIQQPRYSIGLTQTPPQTKKDATLESLKILFMVGVSYLDSQLMCIKLILDGCIPNMNHFPSKVSTTREIDGFKNDVITLIENTFSTPYCFLLCSVFIFGVELGRLKKYWKSRSKPEALVHIKELVADMKKYSEIIDFVFTEEMRKLVDAIFLRADVEDSYDLTTEIQKIEEHFIWGPEQIEKCQTMFVCDGEVVEKYQRFLQSIK
ncbi:Uncharacterized protein QTN25_000566 [Entamoeba marina]